MARNPLLDDGGGDQPRFRYGANPVGTETTYAYGNPEPEVRPSYDLRNPLDRRAVAQQWSDQAQNNPMAWAFPGGAAPGMGLAGIIKAYHGSPHSFSAFDMSKIGTGEGAQAYGHGLYFAGNEGVARSYRDALAPAGTPEAAAAQYLNAFGGNRAAAIAQMTDHVVNGGMAGSAAEAANVRAGLQLLKSGADVTGHAPGHMYEVNLHTNPENLLDWDKPLAGQHPARDALYEAARPASDTVYGDARSQAMEALRQTRNPNLTGEGVNYQLGRVLGGKPQAATALREAGIPGIQYLDAGSRSAGEGSRNYVIWTPELIELVRKYGIAAVLGSGAAGAAAGGTQSQSQ